MMQSLQVEHAQARFDEDSRLVHVTYTGEIDGNATVAVYDWLEQLYHEVDINTIRGQVFDFRQVTSFAQDNLVLARRNSSRMNMKTDVSHCPAALLISDFYHEEILRTGMRISDQNVRKRIVWSYDDALDFINNYTPTAD